MLTQTHSHARPTRGRVFLRLLPLLNDVLQRFPTITLPLRDSIAKTASQFVSARCWAGSSSAKIPAHASRCLLALAPPLLGLFSGLASALFLEGRWRTPMRRSPSLDYEPLSPLSSLMAFCTRSDRRRVAFASILSHAACFTISRVRESDAHC